MPARHHSCDCCRLDIQIIVDLTFIWQKPWDGTGWGDWAPLPQRPFLPFILGDNSVRSTFHHREEIESHVIISVLAPIVASSHILLLRSSWMIHHYVVGPLIRILRHRYLDPSMNTPSGVLDERTFTFTFESSVILVVASDHLIHVHTLQSCNRSRSWGSWRPSVGSRTHSSLILIGASIFSFVSPPIYAVETCRP